MDITKSFMDMMDEVENLVQIEEAKVAGVNPQEVYQEGFHIESKEQADYFIKLIKESEKEIEEIKSVQEAKIKHYEAVINNWAEDKMKSPKAQIEYFTMILKEFASKQYAENPKNKTIKLPFGKIGFRKQADKYEYNDDEIKTFLHENKLEKYIRTKEEVNKSDIKKDLTIKGEMAYIDDKLIPGIAIIKQPEKFEVK